MLSYLVTLSLSMQPNLSARDAFEFSSAIYSHCPKEWRTLAVAIAFQESGLRPSASSTTGDFGIGQVNAKIHGLKADDLLDVSHGARAMCDLLSRLKAQGRPWTDYHTKRPKAAARYRDLVLRHLAARGLSNVLAE